MTDRFKNALDWYVRYFTDIYGGYIPSLPHHDAVQEALTLATESEQLRKVLNGASSLLKANADTIEQLRKERDDAVNNYGLAFELGRKNVLDELAKKVNENGNA